MYKIVFIIITFILTLQAQECALNTNLIKGGAFENDTDLDNWQRVLGTGYIKRGEYSFGWAGDAPSDGGSYFLYATRGQELIVEQRIDIQDCINNGGNFYEVKGYHGGYGDGDTVNFKIEFLDKNSNVVSSYSTGDFTSNKSMEKFSNSNSIDTSVVKAIITITFKRKRGKDIDGYLDNLSLKIKSDNSDNNNHETIYKEGFQGFDIINSLNSRLVRGNFAIAGNTVMCLTEKKEGYGGTCKDSSVLYYTSNMRVSKFIDIDDESDTFNSSSSYIELPSSYEESDDGKSIVWAGLFWQGRLSTAKQYPLRYPEETLLGYDYIETGRNSDITYLDIKKISANKVKLKINNNDYQKVKANKLYYVWHNSSWYNERGVTYSSYADVTSLLQNAKLKKGKNSFTIANILATEGRESGTGVFGGWSLVVVYKEDLSGKVRSISSYFGFDDIYKDNPIEITGLRLPKSGKVSSKAALFSGEGEFRYGRNQIYDTFDWIKISNNRAYNYQYMPDANGNPLPNNRDVGNRNNIFDAHLSGVKRDHIDGKYNDLQVNNDGIDIDIFDLSNIMEGYRDENPEINTIYLKMFSNHDYVTPSMITFATELYAPKICYDYDVKLGEYINLESKDRNFSVDSLADEPLQIKAMIRSQESDFDLIDSTLSVTFTPNDVFKYKKGASKYSPPNTMLFLPAVETNNTQGEIAIGDNVTTSGGVIGANERTYAKMYYDFKKSSFKGKFDLTVKAKISFDGVHKVPYTLSTATSENSIFYLRRCPTNRRYDPIYGMINVERGDSSFEEPEHKRYSLYTQVVGVPYKISVAAYQKDSHGKYNKAKSLTGAFEVELIDASTFENNSTSGYDSICQDPEYHGGAFADFLLNSRKTLSVPEDFPNYPINTAYKSAVFRTWILRAPGSGNKDKVAIYPPQPLKRLGDVYFKLLYDMNKFKELEPTGKCDSACSYSMNDANIIKNNTNNPKDYACYQCLRSYYSIPICSRDNFAIRPSSYSVAIADTNQSKNSKKILSIGYNNKSINKHLSAGYVYKLDINATSFNSRDSVSGYNFKNLDGNTDKKRAVAMFDLTHNGYACADKSDHNLNISIYDGKIQSMGDIDLNGTSITKNAFIVNNVGNYLLHIEDAEWTEVDQQNSPYKPFAELADCDINSTAANLPSDVKKGCLISTSNSKVDTLPDMMLTLHPYKFDLSAIRVENSLNSGSNFIYISDLNNTTKQLPDGVMALNIIGDVSAKGKNNKPLSNYINGCMAQDTKIKINYYLDQKDGIVKSAIAKNPIPMQHFIYNSKVDNLTLVSVDNINTAHKDKLDITFKKKYFYKNGEAAYKSFINFKREFNEPINPFSITIKDFNISSENDIMVADLNNSYYPKNSKDLNTSKLFYYAKAKPLNRYYNDIYDDNITTPIGISIFCNKSLEYCAKYGIDIKQGLTNEYDWWWAKDNNGSSYGAVLIKLDDSKDSDINQKVGLSKNVIDNFKYGIDDGLRVYLKDKDNISYPYEVRVIYDSTMVDKFPYFMFNPNANIEPKLLETIRFVYQNDKWSGGGNTGYVTDFNSTGRRTNKINW